VIWAELEVKMIKKSLFLAVFCTILMLKYGENGMTA